MPNDGSVWKNVVQWRSEVANATALDEALFDMLQFYSPMEPDCVETRVPSSSRSSSSFNAVPPIPKPFTPGACMSEDEMWVYFDNTLGRIGSMQAYLPVFKESVMFGLQQLVDDNIQYVELRIILGAMYDENGTVYTHAQEFQIWLDTLRGSFLFLLNPTAILFDLILFVFFWFFFFLVISLSQNSMHSR